MRPIRSARLHEESPHGILLDCGEGITCRVSLLGDDLARVLVLRDGVPRQPRTWMVPAPGEADTPWEGRDRLDESVWPAPEIARERDGDALVLRAARVGVRVLPDPFRLEWMLPDGQVFLQDRPSMAYLLARRGRAVGHYVARDFGDRYYGLGDKTGALDLHGRRLRIAMRDSLGYDPVRGDPLYKHWRFLLAGDGITGTAYGMLYDNGAAGAFDLGAEHDNYYGFFRGYEAVDGDLDYYVFPGPRLADLTPRFLRLTGGMALPPRWTLGYAQTAMAIADAENAQARMEAFIDRCGAEGIPISSFHMGSGYTTIGPKRYVFTWNRAKYPDPEGLMRRFHDAGMRVVANLKPCLLDDHPAYAEAAFSGAFVRDGESGEPLKSQFWDGEGAHLDFTAPAGIRWWQEGLEREVLRPGIDVGWNDNNEYELWDETAECAGFGSPLPLELVRPVHSLLMTRATVEAQRRFAPGQRAFTITRAGLPGVQRYAQSWSGDNTTDWANLRWNLRTGLQMSLSGLLNTGHDVGGFAGPVPDWELLVRWTQMGLLHPRFIMNSWKPDGVINAPWLHPEGLPAIRRAIRLRYRLIPYLYSLMYAAAERGEPVIRPTFLQFQDDAGCVADCDELMLGPFLLAAPVVQPGARVRRLRLPAGPEVWYDYYSEEALPPGAEVEVAAPVDRLPLLVPAGAILPMTATEDTSRLHDELSRLLRLFPGPGEGESRFVLVEDDGITEGGPVTRVTLTLTWTPDAVRLHAEAAGSYALPDTIGVALPAADRRPLRLDSTKGTPALVRSDASVPLSRLREREGPA